MNTDLPDPDLTPEQKEKVGQLSENQIEEIDRKIISLTTNQWQKVAKIVGMTMQNLPSRFYGLPDVYYAHRVKKLAKDGVIESQGNLNLMRFSEIRLNQT